MLFRSAGDCHKLGQQQRLGGRAEQLRQRCQQAAQRVDKLNTERHGFREITMQPRPVRQQLIFQCPHPGATPDTSSKKKRRRRRAQQARIAFVRPRVHFRQCRSPSPHSVPPSLHRHQFPPRRVRRQYPKVAVPMLARWRYQ